MVLYTQSLWEPRDLVWYRDYVYPRRCCCKHVMMSKAAREKKAPLPTLVPPLMTFA